jgi:thiol-disulfide isomerase/thioredoxin
MKKVLLILIIAAGLTAAQDTNKVVIDSRSEKAMLIGPTTREAFSDSSFAWWYNSGYEFYEADTTLIAGFAEAMKSTEILIIMGTWCSDSRREVPHFLKIMDVAGYPEEKIEIINVDREKSAENLDISHLNIELVPTFIFYKDNEEIGRIIETPQKTLEEDIANILSK